jgi:hypothetical protein
MTDTTHELRFGQGAGTRWAFCSADECDWCIPAPGKGEARFQVEHNRHHHQENPS